MVSKILFATFWINSFYMSQCARILLLPFSFSSHVAELSHIGRQLLKEGHSVDMVLAPSMSGIEKWKNGPLNVITHHIIEPDFYSDSQEELDEYFAYMMQVSLIQDLRETIDGWKEMCTNPLSDNVLLTKLKGKKYDLALVDTFTNSKCLLLIPYKLDIPFINVVTSYEPWLLRNPALPSFVPFNMYGAKSTDMTFWQRLDNTYRLLEWTMLPRIPYLDDSYLQRFYGNKPPIPINQLAGKALLWFIDTDFAIDYPRPTMPNEILIGGLTTRPAKPLPVDLERFMNESPEGVIVVSFGSMSTNLPEAARHSLFKAFSQVKQRVVWRYPHSAPENVAENIKLLQWLPQQDLLGHNKTVLFITHCGANGQFEALYHSVPMISIPLFAEQHYNAKRAEYKGFSKTADVMKFTPEELIKDINEVINNSSYKASIARASGVFRASLLSPQERAAWWVNHVIKHGGSNLRSHALDMPWYQYIMLDIFLFVFGTFILALLIISKICSMTVAIVKSSDFDISSANNNRLKTE